MPAKKDNPDEEEQSSSSSWFGSWFERDMRDEIHQQLNELDERKREYQQAQEERRKFFQEHYHNNSQQSQRPSSHPFPFFFPPNSKEDFEDFFGDGRRRGADFEDGEEKRWNPFDQRRGHDREDSIEDFHREMQGLLEAAFGESMGGSSNKNRNGSWSSSSTTVVSSSNGTSYTLKQDSKTGARVDLKLPKNSSSETVSLEVLRDNPCRIRWQNNDNENSNNTTRSAKPNQVLELGNSVDCSKLSASISEAKRTLTVEAPPRSSKEENDRPLSLKPSSYPRPVHVTKKQ